MPTGETQGAVTDDLGETEWRMSEGLTRREGGRPVPAPDAPAAGRTPEPELVCDGCGALNPADSQFCRFCHAFLAWTAVGPAYQAPVVEPPALRQDQGALGPAQGSVGPAPGSVGPAGKAAGPAQRTFRVSAEVAAVTVPVTGEAASMTLRVTNTSEIVDGYAVEIPDAPRWLELDSGEVRLLPGTEELMLVRLRLRVAPGSVVPAQQAPVVLRVRSLSENPAYVEVPVLVTVPVLDVLFGLRAEPSLLRVRDSDTAGSTLVVDNSGSNQALQLRFAGTDPELAVRFRFEPAVLDVSAGASASVRLAVTAPRPEPGQEMTRPLRVAAWDGRRTVETVLTLQQSTPARTEDPPVTLEVEPSMLRVLDANVGSARVTLDNRGGREWAQVQLAGSDPERLVRVTWSQPVVQVPPGQTVQVEARFEAPLPELGNEVSRTVTVSATVGRRTSRATAIFVQATSSSPMVTLVVRLDPSIVRRPNRSGGTLTATLDNRQGARPVRVSMQGDDPENQIGFRFAPATVEIAPGQVGRTSVTLRAPRAPGGQQLTRPFTIVASDGRFSAQAEGSLIQSSTTRRPLARFLCTLFGGLAMIFGALLPWDAEVGGWGSSSTLTPWARTSASGSISAAPSLWCRWACWPSPSVAWSCSG